MALRIRCPNGHLLELEDAHLGHKVRCPRCKIVMMAELPPAATDITAAPNLQPAPPSEAAREDDDRTTQRGDADEYDDADEQQTRKPKKMKKALRVRLLRIGLNLHMAKVIVLLIAVAVGFLTPVALVIRGSAGTIAVLMLEILSQTLHVIWPLLGTIGSLLCLWVPEKTGSKLLIVFSFILDALAMGLRLLAVILLLVGKLVVTAGSSSMDREAAGARQTGAALGGMGLLSLIGGFLLGFAAWVLFMLFLRQLAVYFRDRDIAAEAVSVILQVVGLGVGGILGLGCAIGVVGALFGRTTGGVLAAIFVAIAGILVILGCGVVICMKMLAVIRAARDYFG